MSVAVLVVGGFMVEEAFITPAVIEVGSIVGWVDGVVGSFAITARTTLSRAQKLRDNERQSVIASLPDRSRQPHPWLKPFLTCHAALIRLMANLWVLFQPKLTISFRGGSRAFGKSLGVAPTQADHLIPGWEQSLWQCMEWVPKTVKPLLRSCRLPAPAPG